MFKNGQSFSIPCDALLLFYRVYGLDNAFVTFHLRQAKLTLHDSVSKPVFVDVGKVLLGIWDDWYDSTVKVQSNTSEAICGCCRLS